MSLFKSVATFGGFTLLSRVTGFFRDMVLANFWAPVKWLMPFLWRLNSRIFFVACLPRVLLHRLLFRCSLLKWSLTDNKKLCILLLNPFRCWRSFCLSLLC